MIRSLSSQQTKVALLCGTKIPMFTKLLYNYLTPPLTFNCSEDPTTTNQKTISDTIKTLFKQKELPTVIRILSIHAYNLPTSTCFPRSTRSTYLDAPLSHGTRVLFTSRDTWTLFSLLLSPRFPTTSSILPTASNPELFYIWFSWQQIFVHHWYIFSLCIPTS